MGIGIAVIGIGLWLLGAVVVLSTLYAHGERTDADQVSDG